MITKTLLAASALSVSSVTMPIHQISNRGNFQGTGTLMTFTANLNSSNSLSVEFKGFGQSAPSSTSNSVISVSNISTSDNYSSDSYKQGFYQNATLGMTVANSGFTVQNSANTVNFSQTFANSTSSSGSFSFYYDTPITTVPTASLSDFAIASSYFVNISGINVLIGKPKITFSATATNMGKYFYCSPPLEYKCTISSSTYGSGEEADLTNVVRNTYYPNNYLEETIKFATSVTLSTSLASTYATSLVLSAFTNNVYTYSSTQSTTQSVIIDGPSNTLVYETMATSIKEISSGTYVGYRVWSAPSVSNNCPDLKYNGSYYNTIQYQNSWNLTTTNSGYDCTTELVVYNGLYSTPGKGGYINYSSYLNNSSLNYSGIASSGYRYVTFCWKLSAKSSSYSTLAFKINSISPTPTTSAGGLLLINGKQIQALYCFQDEANPSTYSSSIFNSVWIDANNNENGVTTSTFYNTTNTYGYYGGLSSANGGVSISSNTATINATIPSVNPVGNNTYMYLRLAIPMDVSIGFGSVTATIS
jgi:hypothetical protein